MKNDSGRPKQPSMSKLRQAGAMAALLAWVGAVQADIVVIGAKTAAAMSKEQVADVFTGKATSLPGGAAAVVVDQPEANPMREEFYTKVTGKTAAQAKALWSKLAFTGKGTPPKEAASSAEVKKAVGAAPGGIGYIEKAAVDDTVKVVFSLN